MGASLYEPAFAALGRLYGGAARNAITTITLYGGLASTICWPLSALLNDAVGWRWTCLIYAAVHVLAAVLVYLIFPSTPAERAQRRMRIRSIHCPCLRSTPLGAARPC